jgi:serine/threonine protein kinase
MPSQGRKMVQHLTNDSTTRQGEEDEIIQGRQDVEEAGTESAKQYTYIMTTTAATTTATSSSSSAAQDFSHQAHPRQQLVYSMRRHSSMLLNARSLSMSSSSCSCSSASGDGFPGGRRSSFLDRSTSLDSCSTTSCLSPVLLRNSMVMDRPEGTGRGSSDTMSSEVEVNPVASDKMKAKEHSRDKPGVCNNPQPSWRSPSHKLVNHFNSLSIQCQNEEQNMRFSGTPSEATGEMDDGMTMPSASSAMPNGPTCGSDDKQDETKKPASIIDLLTIRHSYTHDEGENEDLDDLQHQLLVVEKSFDFSFSNHEDDGDGDIDEVGDRGGDNGITDIREGCSMMFNTTTATSEEEEEEIPNANLSFGHCVDLGLDMEGAIEVSVLQTKRTPETKGNGRRDHDNDKDLFSWPRNYLERPLTLPELSNIPMHNNADEAATDEDDFNDNVSSWSVSDRSSPSPDKGSNRSLFSPVSENIDTEEKKDKEASLTDTCNKELFRANRENKEHTHEGRQQPSHECQRPEITIHVKSEKQERFSVTQGDPSLLQSKLVAVSSSTDESSAARMTSANSTQTSPFSFFQGKELPEDTKDTMLNNQDALPLDENTPPADIYNWEFYGEPTDAIGSFGMVCVGINHTLQSLMMVKSYDVDTATTTSGRDETAATNSSKKNVSLHELRREIDIMRSLQHANIVRYLGSSESPSPREKDQDHPYHTTQKTTTHKFHTFQELVPGQTAVTELLERFGAFSTAAIRSYICQLLKGLEFLHQHHIVHCDIKGDNILISSKGVLKIADFGVARQLLFRGHDNDVLPITINHSLFDMDKSTSPMSGSSVETTRSNDNETNTAASSSPAPYFVAPEVYTGQFGRKCDIWSVGGVAYQMITANRPWQSLGLKSPFSLLMHLKRSTGCPPPFHLYGGGNVEVIGQSLCHPELRVLMEFCFQRNPRDRPSARRLLRREFISHVKQAEPKLEARPNPAMQHKNEHHHHQVTSRATSTFSRDSLAVKGEDKALTLTGLSPKIFTDTGSVGAGTGAGTTKHEIPQREFNTNKPITPRSAPRLNASKSRMLPPSSGKKEGLKRGFITGTPHYPKDSTTATTRHHHAPPLSHSGRKLPVGVVSHHTHHQRHDSNSSVCGASISDDHSCCKDSVTLGNKLASHNINLLHHQPLIMFDLAYSDSNESEDLPISIHPLDGDVTSPLSNCSSNGDSISVGHCSIASLPVVSDHWPTWAKQKKEEIDQSKQRSRIHSTAPASTGGVAIYRQSPGPLEKTAPPNKGNIPRPAPRAPVADSQIRKKKANPFAKKAR